MISPSGFIYADDYVRYQTGEGNEDLAEISIIHNKK